MIKNQGICTQSFNLSISLRHSEHNERGIPSEGSWQHGQSSCEYGLNFSFSFMKYLQQSQIAVHLLWYTDMIFEQPFSFLMQFMGIWPGTTCFSGNITVETSSLCFDPLWMLTPFCVFDRKSHWSHLKSIKSHSSIRPSAQKLSTSEFKNFCCKLTNLSKYRLQDFVLSFKLVNFLH